MLELSTNRRWILITNRRQPTFGDDEQTGAPVLASLVPASGREGAVAMALIGEVAAGSPVTLAFNETVDAAVELMTRIGVGDVIVVDNAQRAVGILTDRDIVVRLLAERRDSGTTSVGQICTLPVATVGIDDTIERATWLMASERISRLPVVDTSGRAVGIVSLRELAGSGHVPSEELKELVHTLTDVDPS